MRTVLSILPSTFVNFISEIKLNRSKLYLWFCKSASANDIAVRAQKPREKLKDSKNEVTHVIKAKTGDFTEEEYNETSYFEEKGMRKVYPYYHTFNTFCKKRWLGKTVLEIFSKEMRLYPAEEYERRINSGAVTVNDNIIDINYKLKYSDLIASRVHRHEAPVADQPIKILHDFNDLVVVDKPSSIPVHHCGRYRHNTVLFILAKEFNLKNLKIIHRLDSLTSGLLLYGKNKATVQKFQNEFYTRLVKKEYVCRVVGEFPTGTVSCEEPIEVASHKIGVRKVGPNGKHCKTNFERISYNGKTSVVLCKPLTGRTHQIRVHLQYLGYPIANDPIYNHPAFGPERGKGGVIDKTNEQLIAELTLYNKVENYIGTDSAILSTPSSSLSRNNLLPLDHKKLKLVTDSNCPDCRLAFRDPKPEELVMYLHAWRYQGPNWKFESELPKWMNEN